MSSHKCEQAVSAALLLALLLVGVVSADSSSSSGGDTALPESDISQVSSPGGSLSSKPSSGGGAGEQMEFINFSPNALQARLGKLFELDSGDIVEDTPQTRPQAISFFRPVESKYSKFYRPVRPVASNPSYQFIGDNVMSEARARRYAYPKGQSSQSFLRFGRAFDSAFLQEKRPMKAKDTAFLRFGRSQPF